MAPITSASPNTGTGTRPEPNTTFTSWPATMAPTRQPAMVRSRWSWLVTAPPSACRPRPARGRGRRPGRPPGGGAAGPGWPRARLRLVAPAEGLAEAGQLAEQLAQRLDGEGVVGGRHGDGHGLVLEVRPHRLDHVQV